MGHTILIVDDADFMRAMLRDMVTDMGHEVIGEAADGEEALSLFQERQPDLVLLDLTMPRMDGIEALRKILARDAEAQVVMITALGQKELVLDAIKAGARDFIIKPFDQERVADTLNRILSSAPVLS